MLPRAGEVCYLPAPDAPGGPGRAGGFPSAPGCAGGRRRGVSGACERLLETVGFDPNDIDSMARRLEELRGEHRMLDERIELLEAEGASPFEVMALKRQKLRLKDRISWLSAKLTPDIIA